GFEPSVPRQTHYGSTLLSCPFPKPQQRAPCRESCFLDSRIDLARKTRPFSSIEIDGHLGDRPPRPFPPAPEIRFAHDSALEGSGFEPSVPHQKDNAFEA